MATGNGRAAAPMVSAPDLQGVLEQWQSASAQAAGRSTGVARELVGAGLHWMVQGAEGTRHWAHALDAAARHWSELARMAEHKLRTIDDFAGLWNLELDVAGHGAETGVDWGQQIWAEQMRAWSSLAHDNATPAAFALSAALASAPDVIKTLAEASQAFWSRAAAQASAAMPPAPAQPESADAGTARRPRRARRRG